MAARGTITFDANMTPMAVHHRDGHAWMVWKILEHWETGANASERLRTPGVVERYRLEVSGPLPGGAGEHGRFVMVAETLGNRPWWWLTPG